MLMLGIEIDGSDRTGVWRDRLPMLMLGIVIDGSARLVLGIVIDGSAKLIELDGKLIEGSAMLRELNEGRPVSIDSDPSDKDGS
jgi:hypothetical protein